MKSSGFSHVLHQICNCHDCLILACVNRNELFSTRTHWILITQMRTPSRGKQQKYLPQLEDEQLQQKSHTLRIEKNPEVLHVGLTLQRAFNTLNIF